MNWYLQSGKESDVAISTRIRFSRNINGYSFNLSSEELEKLENKIKESIYEIGYGLKYLKIKDMDEITKISLLEKNLVTEEFLNKNQDKKSILINDEENICIMIGEEDHLKIQVYSAGLELENTLNLAIELDKKLEEVLGYCVSKKYGYLTAYPSNLGTGLKASVMLHLPALRKTNNIKKVLQVISNFGVEIKGITSKDGKLVGDIYQISNKQTLGLTEEEIVKNIKIIAEKIIKNERQARKYLANEGIELEDEIYRSFGILTNCKKITEEETLELLSNIKLGVDLGILKEVTDLQVQSLYLYTKPANMQKRLGEILGKIEQEVKRAEIIKQIFKEK
ncbi:MAG: ATP--guanido phosphotransferase [Clostridia bacterium]|nr:ATP--guanido phosphotransferase [Clostridium sp.]